MGAGGPQGSGRTNAGGHRRPKPHPLAQSGGGPHGSGRLPSRRQNLRSSHIIAKTPVKRYQRPKQRVSSHTKEHVAATPKRVKRQVNEAQHPGSTARQAYERHYRGLWKKFGGQYPLLHGKMPKVTFSAKGGTAYVPWGEKRVIVSQKMANAFVSGDKRLKDWAAETPLHEWQHAQQGAKYGRKGEQKIPEWRLEGRAQNKMYRTNPKPNRTGDGGETYHKYALAEKFPKIAKQLDKGNMSVLFPDYKAPSKKKIRKANERYFKKKVSQPRAGSPSSGFGYALNKSNRKYKRQGDRGLGA